MSWKTRPGAGRGIRLPAQRAGKLEGNMGTWGTAAMPRSQLRDIRKCRVARAEGRKQQRRPSSDPEPVSPGAQTRGGQKEHRKQRKDAPRQRDRDRERQRDRDREDVHWRAKPRKRGRGERAENAYLRRNLWGTASFPKSSRK